MVFKHSKDCSLNESSTKIYRKEFDNTLKLFKEIDFAHDNVQDMLYNNKQQDIRDDNELADIAAKEYRAGGACRHYRSTSESWNGDRWR